MDKGLDLASEQMGRLFQMKDNMCENLRQMLTASEELRKASMAEREKQVVVRLEAKEMVGGQTYRVS